MTITFHPPSINKNDIPVIDLLNRVLGNGFSSQDDLLIDVALDAVEQCALCLQRQQEITLEGKKCQL